MKIAIVGAGIVGATCAYYLSKENVTVKVFDEGYGQATKASAGIISPWFSKRRHKAWYKMARLGADFYEKLIADLQQDGIAINFYQKSGVYLFKKDDSKLEDLYALAKIRKEEAHIIGDLDILSPDKIKEKIPSYQKDKRALFASGGARLEGERLVNALLTASKLELVGKKVALEIKNDKYYINGEAFDKVIVCVGAWLREFLSPLGYEVDVRPQKGQLRDYQIADKNSGVYPVLMPEGELDIIPFEDGFVSVGASHEDDKGFDLSIDKTILDGFEKEATSFMADIKDAQVINERVGIRAYTSDYAPFYGRLDKTHIYLASGLGSSGLTTGAIIGYNLAMLAVSKAELLDSADYPVDRYIKHIKN